MPIQKRQKILFYMIVICFTGSLPWYNFSAVVGYLATEISLNSSDIALIISAFQAGYVALVVVTGWLADQFGPKKVITVNMLLAGIFSSLFALFGSNLWNILVFRVLTGAASGSIYAPGLVLLSQWFPDKRGHAWELILLHL